MTLITDLKHSLVVAREEFKRLMENKWRLVPLFLIPILMIYLSGEINATTVKNSPILIINNDTGSASKSLVQEIRNYILTPYSGPMFSVTYTSGMSYSEAERRINSGIYKSILIIPSRYSDNLAKRGIEEQSLWDTTFPLNESLMKKRIQSFESTIDKTNLVLLTDPSDNYTSNLILTAISNIIREYGTIKTPNFKGGILVYYDYLIPGIIALEVFLASIENIASEIKEEDTLLRKSKIPFIKRSELFGMAIYQVIISLAFAIFLIFAIYLFVAFNMSGNWILVALLLIILIINCIGIGFVLSCVSRLFIGKPTAQLILKIPNALMLLAFVFLSTLKLIRGDVQIIWLVGLLIAVLLYGEIVMDINIPLKDKDKIFGYLKHLVTIPFLLFTGIYFPLSGLPNWMRVIAYCLPLTYVNDAMRTIMIKGQGFNAISTDLIKLNILTVVFFTVGFLLVRMEETKELNIEAISRKV